MRLFSITTILIMNLSFVGHATPAAAQELVFAIVGDHGWTGDDDGNDTYRRCVADMVFGWDPAVVATVGDNNYTNDYTLDGFDGAVGNYWCRYMPTPLASGLKNDTFNEGSCNSGQRACGSEVDHGLSEFAPVPGNHDWNEDGEGGPGYQGYEAYFKVKSMSPFNAGNHFSTHYAYTRGNVDFFAVNSNCLCEDDNSGGGSADCNGMTSRKFSTWLRNGLSRNEEHWKVVYFHHPPLNSGHHGGCSQMDFVWQDILDTNQQGKTIVVAGHDHNYQRITVRDEKSEIRVPLFVVGLSGDPIGGASDCCEKSLSNAPGTDITSAMCYRNHRGALKVTAGDSTLKAEYFYRTKVDGDEKRFLLDTCTLMRDGSLSCELSGNNLNHVQACSVPGSVN